MVFKKIGRNRETRSKGILCSFLYQQITKNKNNGKIQIRH